jgi:hypothetical protein
MDTDNLIAHGRARFDHAAAKRTLKEKYQSKLVFAYNGGMFKAGPELINILTAAQGQQGIYLLDLYETPVIADHKELLKLAQTRWQETMKSWFEEYTQLSKNR